MTRLFFCLPHPVAAGSIDCSIAAASLKKARGSSDSYLGLLYPTEDYKVYG